MIFCLALTAPGFSQSMSNTDNVITLTNTCLNGGVSNGTYNLEVYYYDLDQFASQTLTITGVSVVVNAGVMTITAPGGSFPSTSTGSWSLPDGYPGHIKLTSGSFVAFMNWYGNPDGTIGFNCVPLPVYFSSFTATLNSSHQVVLNWQTGLEQNSTVFEVYRSSTGGTYYKIGQVAASGNSNIPVNYTFTDAQPCSSNTYYLKMLNSQGTPPIYSSYASAGCSTCSCSIPSPVYCNFTINGPDHICSIESPAAYSLSSPVPNFSTITWSVNQSYMAILRTYPDWDASKVSLLKRSYDGGVTLTATLSGCTNVITKYIALGTPYPEWVPTMNCPNVTLDAVTLANPTSITWTAEDVTANTIQTYPGSGAEFQYNLGNGDTYAFGLQYTNACGTSAYDRISGYYCIQCANPPCDESQAVSGGVGRGVAATMGAGAVASVSPNPTHGIVRIQVPAVVDMQVHEVRVVDALGMVRKRLRVPGGVGTIQVDLGDLNNGVYIIQVFDNKTWRSNKVVLAK